MNNFINAFEGELVAWQDADVVLIPSASVITKELFREMKKANKKMVLRVDNFLRNSRNRGAGMTRLLEFGTGVDEVVYQGVWAQWFLGRHLGRQGVVIHNGTDLEIFSPDGSATHFDGQPVYLYGAAAKGEHKQWEFAQYTYQMVHRENPNACLVVFGLLPGGVASYDLDFFAGEKYNYLGPITDRAGVASVMRGSQYFLATYSLDAFSQTYMEALCCGVELYQPRMTAGTPELIQLFKDKGREYFCSRRMVADYIKLFEEVVHG